MPCIDDFTFSKHAVERILDMDLPANEVRECLERPNDIGESDQNDGRLLYFGNRITCVIQQENNTLVTVLWRTHKYWQDDLKRGLYGGRTIREVN